MAKMCNICGGLIMAANEVLGYSGPICSGFHAGYPPQSVPVVYWPSPTIEVKLDRIIELLEATGSQKSVKGRANTKRGPKASPSSRLDGNRPGDGITKGI